MRKYITLRDENGKFDEELTRKVIVANAKYAVNGDVGRNEPDPVFKEITENRQNFKGYSSCGDLIQWSLRRLGFKDEKIINRTDDDGNVPWRVGVNISRLVFSTGKNFVRASHVEAFNGKPGDMGLIGENGLEHVFIIAEVNGTNIVSYDYGQFFNGQHGGKKVTRHIVDGPGGRLHLAGSTLPGRPWIGKLDICSLIKSYYDNNSLDAAEITDDFPIDPERINPYS